MCAIEITSDITPVIATERLTLRGPVSGDAQPLAGLASDLNVAGRTCWLPHPFGEAEAEAAVARAMRLDWQREAQFAIEHRHFGLVGMLRLTARPNGRPELGCWIGRPFWNRGYATEAVRAGLKWVRRDWRKRLVVAGHFADNPASGQVLCKAGFLYTGDVELRRSKARGAEVPTRMMVWLA
ncbi:MAG TPA: GNAT family N-acetyltransferase [Phenylobacterium sp.]|uniref:GNAT family N-acetyltransferase n=1 Tax=Phenylobacterium sp. TaxID=1871053 RepID=UPI002C88E09B|nr:GNAT family N-acetyltransferase [Phenylobacterium sp.]HSV02841.1 GNAT family N-acetyltransferase [Phenylobacterium sp.]